MRFTRVAAALGWLVLAPNLARAATPASSGPEATGFQAFVQSMWPEAEARGVSRATFDAAFAGVVPDPSLAPLTRAQPEFAKPIGAYLQTQVTPSRIAQGADRLARWSAVLSRIEHEFGVPASIVVAIWGLETNYGAAFGKKDVIRSTATLAAMNYRPDLYRTELLAALDMLQAQSVARSALRGSWAGAMGQPQFMPSSYRRYAVDEDGDGQRDIWNSVPDSLASIANFIHQQGWRSGEPWGFEVRLPPGLDPGQSRAGFAAWAALGVVRADGQALPANGDGILFFPAGIAGPAFLVTSNFEVLKTYNFSDAYVISVGQLADRMAGGTPIAAAWPTDLPLSRADRIALQSRLVALGSPVDNREGRISLALRDVIRQAQARVGLVADGNPTTALLKALDAIR